MVNISAKDVYKAWTTPEGLSSWWTRKCQVGRKPGEINAFLFDNGSVEFHFRIDQQVPGSRVRWTGIKAEKMPEEWVGTTLEVDLTPAGEGRARLRFGHKNWKSTEGAFALCNSTWGELMYRLRDYCEGRGRGPLFKG